MIQWANITYDSHLEICILEALCHIHELYLGVQYVELKISRGQTLLDVFTIFLNCTQTKGIGGNSI